MKTKMLGKETVLMFSISMLVSVIAFCCVPQLTEASIGKETAAGTAALVTVLLGAGVLAAAVMLRRELHHGKAEAWPASILRVLLLGGVYLVAALVLSVANGLLAVLFYAMLKNLLTLDQIKGIIDFTAMVLTLLAVPVLISVFWMQLGGSRSLADDVKKTLSQGLNSYLAILIVMLVGTGLGWLILTAFHYLPENFLAQIVKTLLFGAVGGTMMVLTNHTCMKGVNRR